MKLEKGILFNDRYLLVDALGVGASAEVWLAKDTKTGIEVALKIYATANGLDDAGLDIFAREFSLVVNVDHRNLLKPLYYDSCGRNPYLVLPFCKHGSIMKLVGRFTENDAWRLLRDVASGLAWLHAMNPPIIHQDIKPDNIMVGDNGEFKITDFGVSTHLRSTLRKSLSSAFRSAGTIAYMAPERFGKDNTPIMASDVYSLGATAFEMLDGDAPFGDNGGLVQKGGAEVPELKGDYSERLKKVIYKCLSVNPWDRPTAEQLEKYAAAELEGRHIDFPDEKKTFWPKYKIPVICACVAAVVAAGGIVGWNLMSGNTGTPATPSVPATETPTPPVNEKTGYNAEAIKGYISEEAERLNNIDQKSDNNDDSNAGKTENDAIKGLGEKAKDLKKQEANPNDAGDSDLSPIGNINPDRPEKGEQNSDSGGIHFVKHQVKRGESLYDIAKKYGTTPEEIKKLNPKLMKKNLKGGMTIIVPIL